MPLIELTESERTGESVEVVALLLNDKTFVTWVCKVRGPLLGQHQSVSHIIIIMERRLNLNQLEKGG